MYSFLYIYEMCSRVLGGLDSNPKHRLVLKHDKCICLNISTVRESGNFLCRRLWGCDITENIYFRDKFTISQVCENLQKYDFWTQSRKSQGKNEKQDAWVRKISSVNFEPKDCTRKEKYENYRSGKSHKFCLRKFLQQIRLANVSSIIVYLGPNHNS